MDGQPPELQPSDKKQEHTRPPDQALDDVKDRNDAKEISSQSNDLGDLVNRERKTNAANDLEIPQSTSKSHKVNC